MLQSILLHILNRQLTQDEWARNQLKSHSGKSVSINAGLVQIKFCLNDSGLLESSDAPTSDLSFTLPLSAIVDLINGKDALAKRVQMSGDAHFAEQLSLIFKNLNWDFEEELAQKIGDIPARRIHNLFKALFAWKKQAATNLAANVHEYIQEEKQWLIKPIEQQTLQSDLTAIQRKLDELERRVQSL